MEKKKELSVGDIVIVHTILFKPREYMVKKIVGNKAYTDFRTFHKKIYSDQVYEYGKRVNTDWYANRYIVKLTNK